MISLDTMPPDWKFAENHAKAVKPGIVPDLKLHKGSQKICKCCFKPIEKEEVSLCANSKQLDFLGFGFPIYFIFLKYCMILIMILICSYSAVSLYWAIEDNYAFCTHRRLSSSTTSTEGDQHCTSFLIIFSRIQDTLHKEQIILRIASFVIHILALIYIRDNIRKTIKYYDQKTTSMSDFSFIIKKLPLRNGTKQGIRKFVNKHFTKDWQELESKFAGEHYNKDIEKVKQITLLPDISDFYQLEKQKQHLIQEKRKELIELQKVQKIGQAKSNNSVQSISAKINEIDNRLGKKNIEIAELRKKYHQRDIKDELHAQMAIVTLNTEVFKNTIVQFAQENSLDQSTMEEYFGKIERNLQIQQAPEPNEIIWHNINYSAKDRFIGKIIGWSLTTVFIAVVTIGFYFILVAKTNKLITALQHATSEQELHHDNLYVIAVFLVYFFLVLIVVFNKLIMGWALHHFTQFQKHEHTSDQQFSFALKYTLGLFFTTAIMTLAVEAITYHNFYSHQYGVIQEESIMFFITAFFVPLIWFLNPWQLKSLIYRHLSKDKMHFTQGQANKIMSDTPYVMGKRYAQIIQIMWFTFLYATMIPLGAFLTFIGIAIYYWVDKLNLLKRSSLSHNVSGQMALYSLKLLDVTLLLRPIGQIIFDSQLRHEVNASSIVFICVAFVYLILPMDEILEFFHEEQFKQEEKSFQEVKDSFLQTYHTLHPILNHETEQIFKKVQSKLKNRVSLTELNVPAVSSLLVNHILGGGSSKKIDLQTSSFSLFESKSNTLFGIKLNPLQTSLNDSPIKKQPQNNKSQSELSPQNQMMNHQIQIREKTQQ